MKFKMCKKSVIGILLAAAVYAGKQIFIIKSTPVLNGPFANNADTLSPEDAQAIQDLFTSDTVSNDELIFVTEESGNDVQSLHCVFRIPPSPTAATPWNGSSKAPRNGGWTALRSPTTIRFPISKSCRRPGV